VCKPGAKGIKIPSFNVAANVKLELLCCVHLQVLHRKNLPPYLALHMLEREGGREGGRGGGRKGGRKGGRGRGVGGREEGGMAVGR
jgi:hypothetical protein